MLGFKKNRHATQRAIPKEQIEEEPEELAFHLGDPKLLEHIRKVDEELQDAVDDALFGTTE